MDEHKPGRLPDSVNYFALRHKFPADVVHVSRLVVLVFRKFQIDDGNFRLVKRCYSHAVLFRYERKSSVFNGSLQNRKGFRYSSV